MLNEERERKGDVKQMLLDCSKFHGFGWKECTVCSAEAVSLAASGIINRLL